MKLKFTLLERGTDLDGTGTGIWLTFTVAANAGGWYCPGCTHCTTTGSEKTAIVYFCHKFRQQYISNYPICIDPKQGTSFWKQLIKPKEWQKLH